MYTAREYAFITPSSLGGRRYRTACRRLGLEAVPGGYGALSCRDGDGREVTMLTTDVDYLRMVVEAVVTAHDLRRCSPGPVETVRVRGEQFAVTRPGSLESWLEPSRLEPPRMAGHRIRAGNRRKAAPRGKGAA